MAWSFVSTNAHAHAHAYAHAHAHGHANAHDLRRTLSNETTAPTFELAMKTRQCRLGENFGKWARDGAQIRSLEEIEENQGEDPQDKEAGWLDAKRQAYRILL
ncbi:unnamed protein product [Diplocarpon coronariae]|nr:hypothetical protein JHW43_005297 [Diplocarpon mali]